MPTPRFRTARSTAHPGVTLYTLPPPTTETGIAETPTKQEEVINDVQSNSSITIASVYDGAEPGYASLRRTTRSLHTTPKKDVSSQTISVPSVPGPSKRPRRKQPGNNSADPGSDVEQPDPISPITPKRKRTRTATVAATTPVAAPSPDESDIKPPTTTPKRTPKKPLPLAPLEIAHPVPEGWQAQYRIIERMRRVIVAPVDTMGCERPDLPDLSAPTPAPAPLDTNPTSPTLPTPHPSSPSTPLPSKTQRFHTLISLMLSSQTKDAITAAAINNLHGTLPGGLTCRSLAAAPRDVVEGCINKVGFWRRKAEYIQLAARQLLADDEEGEQGSGDVPRTIEALCRLKGVGPKMAYLALQCAWNINAGIGVDVHVHRITNRLGWHKPATITPEQTRVNLESWLPKELHKGINPMLVGFGQTICLPVGPRCDICLLGQKRMCPSRVGNVRTAGRKVVEYTFDHGMGDLLDMEDMVSGGGVKVEVKDEELVKLEHVVEQGVDGGSGELGLAVLDSVAKEEERVLVKLEQT